MFSFAYWQAFCMHGYADDGYGNPVALPNDAWEMAWRWKYAGTLEGSYNRSYPLIEQIH